MLNQKIMADVAADARGWSGMGTSLACSGAAVLRDRALAIACPHAAGVAVVYHGSGTTAAGPEKLVRQQRSIRKYAHSTRIATAFGGAMGPHPARDPV
jgi:hypothetical protein